MILSLNLITSPAMHRAFALLILGFAAPVVLSYTAVAQSAPDPRAGRVGVLVMAHGGDEAWNDRVVSAIQPVAERAPTVVAFGMADPDSLRIALDSLAQLGAGEVAVVRLFLSGASFLTRTEHVLGLADRVAARPAASIPHDMTLATHPDGIVASDEARDVLAERAWSLSTDPASESVLLLAHGNGDDDANDRLLAAMDGIARRVAMRPFHTVRSAALKEDWPEARAAAEREIRDFVRSENDAGRTVIVVPVRVFGFGPYAAVLEGLDYRAADALLPDPRVGTWIRRTVERIARASGWESPFGVRSVSGDRPGPGD